MLELARQILRLEIPSGIFVSADFGNGKYSLEFHGRFIDEYTGYCDSGYIVVVDFNHKVIGDFCSLTHGPDTLVRGLLEELGRDEIERAIIAIAGEVKTKITEQLHRLENEIAKTNELNDSLSRIIRKS